MTSPKEMNVFFTRLKHKCVLRFQSEATFFLKKLTDNLKRWTSALRPKSVSTTCRCERCRRRSRRSSDLRSCFVRDAEDVAEAVDASLETCRRRFPSEADPASAEEDLWQSELASSFASTFCRSSSATTCSTKTTTTNILRLSNVATSVRRNTRRNLHLA